MCGVLDTVELDKHMEICKLCDRSKPYPLCYCVVGHYIFNKICELIEKEEKNK